MEDSGGSQFSEAELRSAAVELVLELRNEFRSARRPDVTAHLDLIRERLVDNRAGEAVAMWRLVAGELPAATPSRRKVPVDLLAGTLARALSELTGSQVPEPDFDAPAPASSFGTAVKRSILLLVGAACLVFGITILRLPERERGEEIFRIAIGALFVIGGPVFLVRALIGDRRQVDNDFWKVLDGL